MICTEVKDGRCHGHDDDCNGLLDRTRAADVILLGSPVYFGSLTGQIKAYMDRVRVRQSLRGQLPQPQDRGGRRARPARGSVVHVRELNMWFLINGHGRPGQQLLERRPGPHGR